jgi:MSHA pilin protein MshD
MNRLRHQGFTLLELIIFIVVVGVGLAGILTVSNNVVKSSADPMVRKQAMALADSILEEILQKEYEDPDGLPNVVELGRDTYDDVDDYDGKTKAIFTDWPPTLSSYTVAISVTPTTLSGVAAKKVTVAVTGGSNSITLTGYRTKY